MKKRMDIFKPKKEWVRIGELYSSLVKGFVPRVVEIFPEPRVVNLRKK